MKKFYLLVLFLFAFVLTSNATQLTGHLQEPDGTGFTGTLYLSIAQQVGISSADGCGGPMLVVPTVVVPVTITNGTIINPPNIYGGECTLPQGMPYNAILKDNNGNTMFSTQWLITGTTQDIGTVYQGPSPIPPTAFVVIPGVGTPAANNLNPCSITSMYIQLDAAPGGNMWSCISGTFTQQVANTGGAVIGATVGAGTSKSVLLVGPTGLLAQDNSSFNYDVTTHTLSLANLNATNITGTLSGNASTATALQGVPSSCPTGNYNYGIDVHGNANCRVVQYSEIGNAPTVFGASGASHTSGLVPDPGATAGTTRYLREDGTFAVPPGGSGGTYYPIAYSTSQAGTVLSALTSSGTTAAAVAESSSAASDYPYMGVTSDNRYGITNSSPASFHLLDYRNHKTIDYCYNTKTYYTNATCHFFTLLNDTRDSTVAGTAPNTHINLTIDNLDIAPGMYDTGQWSGNRGIVMFLDSYTKGIDQPISSSFSKSGVGDWANYNYFNYASGSPEGDDEGGTAYSNQLRENAGNPNDTTANITAVASDNTSINFNTLTGWRIGAGRPAILVKDNTGADAAWLTTTATSIDGVSYTTGLAYTNPGNIVVPAAVTPSTGIGILTADLTVPANLDIPQSVSFDVNITGGSAAGYNANAYACINGGTHFEKVYITAVTGTAGVGNVQHITANVRQSEIGDQAAGGAHPQFWQDNTGICGSYVTVAASNRTSGATPIRQFVPLLGASDSHTLRYGFPAQGSNRSMMLYQNDHLFPEVQSTSFTSSGGVGTAVTTLPPGGAATDWSNRSGIVVTGTTNFNGTYTFLPTITSGTYTFVFSGGDFSVAQVGTSTSSQGRNVLKAYYGTEVINPGDPNKDVDGVPNHYAGFAPNTVPWAVNATVEFPMYVYMPVREAFDTMFAYSAGATGKEASYQGPAVSDNFVGYTITNNNAVTQYNGFGGYLGVPIAGIALSGPFANGIDFSRTAGSAGGSIIPGGIVLNLGCPVHLSTGIECGQGNDAYTIFAFGTKQDNGIGAGYASLADNVPNDSLDIYGLYPFAFSFGKHGWKIGSDYNNSPGVGGIYSVAGAYAVHLGTNADLILDYGNIYLASGKGIGFNGSQVVNALQGSTGTKVMVGSGAFTQNNLLTTDAFGNSVDSSVSALNIAHLNVANTFSAVQTFTSPTILSMVKTGNASNTDLTGELVFSAATTGTYTFTGTYTSHPECWVQAQATTATSGQPWLTYTGVASFTANFPTAFTGTVSYGCIARN